MNPFKRLVKWFEKKPEPVQEQVNTPVDFPVVTKEPCGGSNYTPGGPSPATIVQRHQKLARRINRR